MMRPSAREMKILSIIPIIIAIFCVSTNTSFGRTPEYIIGYNAGLNNQTTSSCEKHVFGKTTSTNYNTTNTKEVHCETGVDDGELTLAKTTPPYKIGYQLGKNDSIMAVNDAYNACKNFNSININTNKERMCEQGYDKAYNDYLRVNQPNSSLIIAKYKQEPAYRAGFAAGAVNGNLTAACNAYSNKSSTICNNAYQNGFDSNEKKWAQTKMFKQGYAFGVANAKSGTTGDSVGDCNEEFVTEAVLNLCLAGWHAGFVDYCHKYGHDETKC
ncbi:MAG: hypothetical protein WA667_13970 [Candidatus Nitrosopolaris sp.]